MKNIFFYPSKNSNFSFWVFCSNMENAMHRRWGNEVSIRTQNNPFIIFLFEKSRKRRLFSWWLFFFRNWKNDLNHQPEIINRGSTETLLECWKTWTSWGLAFITCNLAWCVLKLVVTGAAIEVENNLCKRHIKKPLDSLWIEII